MFVLTRELAKKRDVAEIVVPLAMLQQHLLAPLASRCGMVACRNDMVRATVMWARLQRDVPHIVSELVAQGVRVAPIKGVAYAAGLYSAPAERPMSDVDLLVERGALRMASAVLGRMGFELYPDPELHHASTWVRGDLVIDLHHGILGDGRSRMDLADVWSRMVAGWPSGADRLEPVDELAFHLLHMARNRLCGPLIQVVDAAHLVERASIREALERAERWGVGRAARTAWQFVDDILEDRAEPGGVLGPQLADVLAMRQPHRLRKVVFDTATAGSPSQLLARARAVIAALRFRARSS